MSNWHFFKFEYSKHVNMTYNLSVFTNGTIFSIALIDFNLNFLINETLNFKTIKQLC